MKLRELLQIIQNVQQKIDVPPVMLCGGTVRDKFMNKLENVDDLDLTNGTKSIDYLSQELNIILRKKYNVTRKTMSDGHSTIFIGNLKVDFSSNFVIPDIDKYLSIKNPSLLQKEMFSRDFTCNALLMSLDLKTITDPTHKGFQDIKDKKIKTCLAPDITLISNRNRVIRAIYLACKLDFDIDDSIISYVKNNPQSVKISTPKVLNEKISQAFEKDADRAAYFLNKMDLWNLVPITPIMEPYYSKIQGNNV